MAGSVVITQAINEYLAFRILQLMMAGLLNGEIVMDVGQQSRSGELRLVYPSIVRVLMLQ